MPRPATQASFRPTLRPLLYWGIGLVAAIAIGAYARTPSAPVPADLGPVFPRVDAHRPDLASLLGLLGIGSVTWYAAVIALPLLVWGARRVALDRHARLRSLGTGVLVLGSLVLATARIQYFVVYHAAPLRPDFIDYLPTVLRSLLLPWVALMGVVVTLEARRRAVHAMIERERLRAQVAEQRLIALYGQLQPHFIFNTLQGISTLIHRDPEAADAMLIKLGDLLGEVLRHRDQLVVPLSEELRFARTYLEIAEMRLAGRLTFTIAAAPELLDAAVPLFILQPLVENALIHGIGGRASGGRIALSVTRSHGRLEIQLADDGAGLAGGTPQRERVGLGNLRERLRTSFGTDQSVRLEPAPGGGVVARIEFPFRRYAAREADR